MAAAPRTWPLLALYAASALAWGFTRWAVLTYGLGAGLGLGLVAILSLVRAAIWLVPAGLYAGRGLGESPVAAFALGAPARAGLARALLVGAAYLGAIIALTYALGGALPDALPPPALLALLVFDAAVEEAAFRGFLLLHLARGRRFAAANALTALLFLLVHAPLFWTLWSIGLRVELLPMAASLYVLALALGEATRATRSIWIAVAIHAINNVIAG
jgi:membrane protease YdiL (CAAX protease family)